MENAWDSNYRSKQGNIGLGAAIAYYTLKGYSISIPLNDTQKYDLVVDKENILYRVSIKTTQGVSKQNGKYIVQLKHAGGSGVSKVTTFDNKLCDILFIITKEGTMYEIPSDKVLSKNSLTLNESLDQYIVKLEYNCINSDI